MKEAQDRINRMIEGPKNPEDDPFNMLKEKKKRKRESQDEDELAAAKKEEES